MLEDGSEIQVPCGKCLHCLKSKRSAWSQRLIAEYQHATCVKFCTVTYDEPSLFGERTELNKRIRELESHFYVEDDDTVFYTVSKIECQKFFKRLRRQFGSTLGRFKYWLVSEFGDASSRPHYHFFLFLDKYFTDSDIQAMILKTWCLGYIIDAQDVRGVGAFGYLVNYMYKQVGYFDTDKEDELIINAYNSDYPDFELDQAKEYIAKVRKRPKTFMLASRRPAIGMSYLKSPERLKWHLEDSLNNDVLTLRGVKENIPLCGYLYKKVYGNDTQFRRVKMEEQTIKEQMDFEEENPDKNFFDYVHERREFEHFRLKNKE